jgi:hypothetical protein
MSDPVAKSGLARWLQPKCPIVCYRELRRKQRQNNELLAQAGPSEQLN